MDGGKKGEQEKRKIPPSDDTYIREKKGGEGSPIFFFLFWGWFHQKRNTEDTRNLYTQKREEKLVSQAGAKFRVSKRELGRRGFAFLGKVEIGRKKMSFQNFYFLPWNSFFFVPSAKSAAVPFFQYNYYSLFWFGNYSAFNEKQKRRILMKLKWKEEKKEIRE